ncbi:hypothetical protein [Streptomyces sp. NPDC056817]|uniref:hypothetical protein n=1 Tax=Streptomyces sp. NPDC056817 TaxID=3345950 RepID=UPI003697D959
MGLLVRLLSLPDGSGATVEKITALVPNGRRTVAKAMNELIEAGYVKRAKVQDPESGRWVTITSVTDSPDSPGSPTSRPSTVGAPKVRASAAIPNGIKNEQQEDTTPPQSEPQEATVQPSEGTEKGGEGEATFLHKIGREMAREARRILERLSLHKSLPLTDQEIARLAPRVAPWLREDYRSDDILRCLTAKLPEDISSVPGLITHRLKTFTPERSAPQPSQAAPQPVKRTFCEVCEATFPLGHQGGVCRGCQAEMDRAAARFATA